MYCVTNSLLTRPRFAARRCCGSSQGAQPCCGPRLAWRQIPCYMKVESTYCVRGSMEWEVRR